MNKLRNANIVKLSYSDLFEHIKTLSFSREISFITIDSDIFNNLSNLQVPEIINNFLIVANNKNNASSSKQFYYKKINKSLLKKISTTDIIISININECDDDNVLRNTIQALILLVNSQGKNIILYNVNSSSEKNYNYIIHSINALQSPTKKEQYEYIYDKVCDELDCNFEENNYCDFKNDKCIANRKKVSSNDIMGCCYSFRYSTLGKIIDKDICKYLNGKKCSTKCMTCKLYTCRYLKSKGIVFKAKDNILLSSFFNKKQLRVLSCNYFIPKEKIIEKLLEEDNLPYIVYYIMCKEYIPVEL